MSDDGRMSRRGILRGDWFKQICQRGAEAIEKEQEPEFVLKRPPGQSRKSGFVHRPPHAVSESEFVVGCTKFDACIQACPPHAIYQAPESEGQLAGFPIIDPESQPLII